jgi:hypothetical protein
MTAFQTARLQPLTAEDHRTIRSLQDFLQREIVMVRTMSMYDVQYGRAVFLTQTLL